LGLVGGAAHTAPGQPAQSRRLLPVDDGVRDPSWRAFRARLLEALKAHDIEFVLGVLDPKIANSFGEDTGGVDKFTQTWGLERPDTSALWKELTDVLTLGGTFRAPGDFCAPYVFTSFPDDLDAFEHAVITREHARLYARPDARSRIVAQLSYDIVRVDRTGEVKDAAGHVWEHVITLPGQAGYVRTGDVRSPLDYRACFKRTRDGWRMTTLAAGD